MCCAKVFYSNPIGQFPDSFNLRIYRKASCMHFIEYQKEGHSWLVHMNALDKQNKKRKKKPSETDFHFTISSEVLLNVNNYVSTTLIWTDELGVDVSITQLITNYWFLEL